MSNKYTVKFRGYSSGEWFWDLYRGTKIIAFCNTGYACKRNAKRGFWRVFNIKTLISIQAEDKKYSILPFA